VELEVVVVELVEEGRTVVVELELGVLKDNKIGTGYVAV